MRSRGFTLIELMISIALFGLIAAGAMSLVLSGARTQTHSARVDVAQSALRAAVDFITRDVLSASAGAPGGVITPAGGTSANAVNIDGTLVNGTGANSSDILDLYTVDGTTAAQLSAQVGSGVTSLPITYLQTASGPTGQFLTTGLPYNAFVQVFDPNAKTAAVVSMSGAASTALAVGAMPATFAAYAYVMPSRHVTYSVSTTAFAGTTTSNTSMLMMSVNGSAAQPLAEGVEDMQIAYGFDNNGDGIVTEAGASAGDDEWLYNVAGETVGAWQIANLRAIRVTLVVKGTSIDTGQTNLPARPAAEDHAAGSTDGFIRRVLRTEIAVRNFNL
jgi:prepilin-type N-terminal cleavage/methylation domain-containing protein